MGLMKPLRVVPVWDVIDAGDVATTRPSPGDPIGTVATRQCSAAGAQVTVQASSNTAETGATCTAAMVVTRNDATYNDIVLRTSQAISYWSSTLLVRPVLDTNITIASDIVTGYALTSSTVPAADLALIMTARPSPNVPIAGYATCLQFDQWNRCTVGLFNWVPELLNVAQASYASVIESELHTALHELTHVLGGMNPVLTTAPAGTTKSMFLSWPVTGGAASVPRLLPPGLLVKYELDTSFPTSSRTIAKVNTTNVLAVTRAAYGCPNATGMPLEDVPLGAGAHWEARLLGGEYMSYGTSSSQLIVSELTLAFLKDTGQYAVNASAGGILFPPMGAPGGDASVYGAGLYSATVAAALPTPAPPGWPLYGRGAGCAFLDGPPAAWPAAYTCPVSAQYGCTPDNRMSAVCVISGTMAKEPPFYSRYVDANGLQQVNPVNSQCSSGVSAPVPPAVASLTGTCGVPPPMAPFSTPAAAAAASGVSTATQTTTSGFSSSMDYVPVPVGYWSCNAATTTANVSVGAESSGSSLSSFTSLFGVTRDMSTFGGQARCENCRCLISSLLPLTQAVTLTQNSVYGLCYVINCYSTEYLQVGIYSSVGLASITWYRCPPAGGQINIVGYTGTITCPPAASFCAMETPSAIIYPETNFLWVMILWGGLGGSLALVLFFCACGLTRDFFVSKCKRCCGAMLFETEYVEEEVPVATGGTKRLLHVVSKRELIGGAAQLPARPSHPGNPERLPATRASWTLWTLSLVCIAGGLALAGFGGYLIGTARVGWEALLPLIGVGVGIAVIAGIGWCASRVRAEKGPSCWLSVFVGLILLVLFAVIWLIAYYFAQPSWGDFAAANYALLVPILPARCSAGSTVSAQEVSLTACLTNNLAIVGVIVTAVLVLLLVCAVAAALLLHITTFVALTLTIGTWAAAVGGVLIAVIGAYLLAILGGQGFAAVAGAGLGVGLFVALAATVGLFGIFRKSVPALLSYLAFLALVVIMLIGFCWLFLAQGAAVLAYVSAVPDAAVDTFMGALGVTASKQVLISQLSNTLLQIGISFALVLVVYFLLIGDAVAYLFFTRDEAANRWRFHEFKTRAGGNGSHPAAGVAAAAAVGASPATAKMVDAMRRSSLRSQQQSQSSDALSGGDAGADANDGGSGVAPASYSALRPAPSGALGLMSPPGLEHSVAVATKPLGPGTPAAYDPVHASTRTSDAQQLGSTSPALPQGWKAHVSESSGATYYMHEDGRCAWVAPSDPPAADAARDAPPPFSPKAAYV